jgi:hypothetical protein
MFLIEVRVASMGGWESPDSSLLGDVMCRCVCRCKQSPDPGNYLPNL